MGCVCRTSPLKNLCLLVARKNSCSTAIKAAFALLAYFGKFRQIGTPVGTQNVRTVCILARAPIAVPTVAEIGQAWSEEQLNQRVHLLLAPVPVPGKQVVILVKILIRWPPQWSSGGMVCNL